MGTKNSPLLLKILILLGKLKKPLVRKLLCLKKMKKLKLLEQYSYYGYVKEYEFSPPTTPLIHQFRRMSSISLKKLYSNLVMICRNLVGIRNKEAYRLEMGFNFNSLVYAQQSQSSAIAAPVAVAEDEDDDDDDDDDCVDERAERFIQSFYEEMRRQRNESQLLLRM